MPSSRAMVLVTISPMTIRYPAVCSRDSTGPISCALWMVTIFTGFFSRSQRVCAVSVMFGKPTMAYRST